MESVNYSLSFTKKMNMNEEMRVFCVIKLVLVRCPFMQTPAAIKLSVSEREKKQNNSETDNSQGFIWFKKKKENT